MNRDEARMEIKSRYAEYLQEAPKRISGQPSYICPICGNGTGSDGTGMTIDPHAKNPYTLHCFKGDCGFHGDIIDLYKEEHSCGYGEAFQALCDRFGIVVENDAVRASETAEKKGERINNMPIEKNAAEGRTEATEGKPDYTAYYKACKERINDPAAREYLSFRGISEETAAAYWIGYDPAADPASAPGAMGDEYKPHPCPRLIIPFDRSHYMGRSILEETPKIYKKLRNKQTDESDTAPPFNMAALYNEAARPVFITEGAIDALSIIEAGGEAVALNSASNRQRIIEALKKKKTRSTLILCLDNDNAGEEAAAQLADGLRELNISFVKVNVSGDYNDPNEALTSDRAAFIEAVAAAERPIIKPHNTADYIRRSMSGEIEALRAQSDRKTGFPNLDAEAGSIYAGLYAVGGISSVGKTTFISQIADQMAEQGQHVLFFSMEQSRLEMISKSLARYTVRNALTSVGVSSLQIRTGAGGDAIEDAIKDYTEAVGDRVSIIEGNFNCTVGFIKKYTEQYIEQNGGVKPVVIIDYLHVIQAEADPETGRKTTDTRQIVDHNVTELKRLSRSMDIPVFVISSLNRSNYLTPIDFESFKESGGIEYTADVVWGLQLSAVNDSLFDNDKKTKEKREKIAEAKEAMPRDVELVCLKNRYGKSRYTVKFKYYPQYDQFVPEQTESRRNVRTI